MKRYIRAAVTDLGEEDAWARIQTAKTSRSPEIIEQCFNDENYNVVAGLLCNPNTPEHMINTLLENPFYQDIAARSLETRPDIFNKLVSCPDRVRKTLVKNPKVPEGVLARLWLNADLRSEVSANPGISDELLRKSVYEGDEYSKAGATQNPKISSELLGVLATDADHYVREGVACNLKTPVDILKKLAKDSNDDVRYLARTTLREMGQL